MHRKLRTIDVLMPGHAAGMNERGIAQYLVFPLVGADVGERPRGLSSPCRLPRAWAMLLKTVAVPPR